MNLKVTWLPSLVETLKNSKIKSMRGNKHAPFVICLRSIRHRILIPVFKTLWTLNKTEHLLEELQNSKLFQHFHVSTAAAM